MEVLSAQALPPCLRLAILKDAPQLVYGVSGLPGLLVACPVEVEPAVLLVLLLPLLLTEEPSVVAPTPKLRIVTLKDALSIVHGVSGALGVLAAPLVVLALGLPLELSPLLLPTVEPPVPNRLLSLNLALVIPALPTAFGEIGALGLLVVLPVVLALDLLRDLLLPLLPTGALAVAVTPSLKTVILSHAFLLATT